MQWFGLRKVKGFIMPKKELIWKTEWQKQQLN